MFGIHFQVMVNVLNMDFNGHDEGHSRSEFLETSSGPSRIPIQLGEHKNIIKLRHRYTASTDRFKKYLRFLVPHHQHIPVEMTSRTTFLVMDYCPFTLKSLTAHQTTNEMGNAITNSATFISQTLYQILSAIYYLQSKGIVHRNVSSENVLMDDALRPMLSDFAVARSIYGADGRDVVYCDRRQLCVGNSQTWSPEISKWVQTGPPEDDSYVTLRDIFTKSDMFSVGSMFHRLLAQPMSDDQSMNGLFGSESCPKLPEGLHSGLAYTLRQLVKDDPLDRPSLRKSILRLVLYFNKRHILLFFVCYFFLHF